MNIYESYNIYKTNKPNTNVVLRYLCNPGLDGSPASSRKRLDFENNLFALCYIICV